jgi:hypothetical protein
MDLMIHDIDTVSHVLSPGRNCTIQPSGTGGRSSNGILSQQTVKKNGAVQ